MEKKSSGVHDMTSGSVRGHIVRMTLFMLTGMLVQTLYSLVDLYWVGRLGKEAVAAVALSTNLMFAALAITQMLSVGCVALVSQAAGRKEHDEVQRLFNQTQSLSTLAGFLFFGVAFASRHVYAERLAGDAATAAQAEDFLSLFIPALALQFTMVGLGSALRGIGNMRPGLVAQTGSVVLNMVLAPFLIFGWGTGHPLGVRGAALATLIATAAAVVGLTLYLVRGETYLRVRFSLWRPDLATWGKLLGIGLPAGTEFLLMSVTIGAVYMVTRSFGPQAQAGFGIGSRVLQAGMMPAVSLSFACAAVVGQNYGARAFERVRETFREGAKIAVGVMLVFTVLCHLAPGQLIAVFSGDPSVLVTGIDYVETISWGYTLSGLIFVSAGIFQGLGNTWPSLLASVLRAVLFVGPIVWMSRRPGFELHTVWLASVASVFVQFVVQQTLLRLELARRAPLSAA